MLVKKKRKKGKRKVQEVQARATIERGGEVIFGLYLFLKRKEEGKLEELKKIKVWILVLVWVWIHSFAC